MAGALRRCRPGRGAAGLHREPVLRPPAGRSTTSAGSRAHVRGLAAVGDPGRRGRRQLLLAALDRVGDELRAGHLRVPARRRGHPHRHRAAGHRDRRRRRGPAAHRPEPQRPGRHRPAPVHQAGARRRRPAGARACSRCCSTGPEQAEDAYLPGLHPPAAGPAGAARPSPAGPRLGPGPRHRPAAGHPAPPRRVAARRRRPGRLVAAPRPRRGGRRPRLRAPASRTRSTPCPTATSWPRPCSTWPCSACTCPGSARRSCCGRARSSASSASTTPTPPAARCCPRRRTPTSPSWPGARRAA